MLTKPVYINFADIAEETSPIKDGYYIKLMQDADLCAGIFNCLEVPCYARSKCNRLLNKMADVSSRQPLNYHDLLKFSTEFSKLRLES